MQFISFFTNLQIVDQMFLFVEIVCFCGTSITTSKTSLKVNMSLYSGAQKKSAFFKVAEKNELH
jgi:hypothetical protein